MSLHDAPPSTQQAATAQLGRRYGSCRGHSALAREMSAGSWQVKIHDPTNRLAGHDGWLLLGTGWPTLEAASDATGMSW